MAKGAKASSVSQGKSIPPSSYVSPTVEYILSAKKKRSRWNVGGYLLEALEDFGVLQGLNFLHFLSKNEVFFRRFILTLIFILGISIRMFAVISGESVIHEYDPYFNFRMTTILKNEGYKAFWGFFDDKAWYPLGRSSGQTLYPGLMITSHLLYKVLHFLGFDVNIRDVCVQLPTLFGGFTGLAAYSLAKEATGSAGSALFAGLFMVISPSYISRSVAGAYDNEAISIFALVFSFYTWIRAVHRGSMLSALYASFASFYMAASWGAYVFVINIIALHIVALIVLKKFELKHFIVYSVYYVIFSALSLNIPFISYNIIMSSEHMSSHATFLFCNLYMLVSFLKKSVSARSFALMKNTIIITFIVMTILLFVYLSLTGKTSWSERSVTLLDPTYAIKYNPIVASVSEHQASTWFSYFHDIHLILLLLPIGLWILWRNGSPAHLFLGIYVILSAYFAGLMIRLMLVLAPAACVASGVGLSYTLNCLCAFRRKFSPEECLGFKAEDMQKALKKSPVYTTVLSLAMVALLSLACIYYLAYASSMAVKAYSGDSLTHKLMSRTGNYKIMDDYREAYAWLSKNTHPDSIVMSWWDYGYQTAMMGDRAVVVDNNTWNTTHISSVGLALCSSEIDAYKVVKKLKADYVFVTFGGAIGLGGDDLNKYYWILKIAAQDFPVLSEDYLSMRNRESTEKNPFTNSLIYKLVYNGFIESRLRGRDQTRGINLKVPPSPLELFEEAYSTTNWLIRVYKVKDPPNRNALYDKEATPYILSKFSSPYITG